MSSLGFQKYHDVLLSRQPTGRLGTKADFAGLILFLSSKASAHMTGNVLEIDGGSTRSGYEVKKTNVKL